MCIILYPSEEFIGRTDIGGPIIENGVGRVIRITTTIDNWQKREAPNLPNIIGKWWVGGKNIFFFVKLDFFFFVCKRLACNVQVGV
jgi:hypothetical protein